MRSHGVYCTAISTFILCFSLSCSKKTEAPETKADLRSTAAPGATALSSTVPVDVANSGNPSRTDWLNFAWQTFVAVNWPAAAPTSTAMAQPDTTKTLGAKASNGAVLPTVWLLYRDLATVMLPAGANPGAWPSGMPAPPSGCTVQPPAGSVAPGFQPMVLDMVSKFSKFPSETEQATNNPLVDQAGWYVTFDVRMDQSEFTYIQQNGYYDAAKQIAAFQPGGPGLQPFPKNGQESYFNPALPAYAQYGALEVKAAWRVLDPQKDIFSRYYTQEGYFLQPDGTTCQGPVTFGLIGLHILRLTPTTGGTWFWATFEQVDNITVPSGIKRPDGTPLTPTLAAPNTPNGQCTSAYNVAPPAVKGNIPWDNKNAPVNVCQVSYPIPSDVQAINQNWQGQVQGTPFAYYQLDNTINPVPAGQGFKFPPINDPNNPVETDTLANMSMETYFQEQGQSCMTCHGYGAPQGAPQPLTGTNQIFTFVLSNADSSSPTAALKRRLILLPLNKFPHHQVMKTAPKRKQ